MITVLAAAAALILYFLLVCVVLRLTRQKHSLTVFIAAAVSVFSAILLAFGHLVSFWHFASYFALVVIGVIFLYGLALKSLSLGMLTTLAESGKSALSHDELAERVVRPAFLDRIAVLADRRMIEMEHAGYVATKMGVASAANILRLREALKLNSSGLYGA